MRLVTFTDAQSTRLGLLNDHGVVDLQRSTPQLPTDMLAFLQQGEVAREQAASAADSDADFAIDEITLQSPILRPGKILAVGLNYRAHAEESGLQIPRFPVIFTKQNTSINGPYQPIHWSPDGDSLDYEGELAVVIGKRCRRVPAAHAAGVIAGFCVANDVSVRSWQMRGNPAQFTMGKSWDTHCPLGPALVTADSVDPHNLRLQTWVNEVLRQDSNTNDLIFNCYEIIEFLSTAFTLEPGDVIVTGTPAGVGAAMQPPQKLMVGDRVKVAIEGLGHIENEVISEPSACVIY